MAIKRRAMRLILPAALAGVLLAVTPVAAQAAKPRRASSSPPSWTTMKALLEKKWKETGPTETIIAIEKVGEPEFAVETGKTETLSSTNYSWDWDWNLSETTVSSTIKGREGLYARQTAVATVERANKTRARFTVAALYKKMGSQWQFAEMPVGKVEELAGAGAPTQPSSAEASRIFAEGWKNARPDFTVDSVEVLAKPEFHQYQNRYWLSYKLAVNVTGTAKGSPGKKFKCSPSDDSSVLKWDADKKAWLADESVIRIINESAWCEAQ